MDSKYNIQKNEKKWQQYWVEKQSFKVKEDSAKQSFYILEMFPYPSGTLHMGHARNYSIGDVVARYHWAKGFNVLHPMGWDACGLPAENAALKHGVHPKEWTYSNALIMKQQCLSFGFSHDWSREIFTCDPAYFGHEQALFLDFYEKGLAYRKKSYVNWDPKDQSVLANEQVIDGRGWRSGAIVEKRLLEQWFLKITDFANELLQDLQQLTNWPESVRQMQSNWIGRSHGLMVNFRLDSGQSLKVFSTRADTLYGATFCAVAPEHPMAQQWAADNTSIAAFIENCKKQGTSSRIVEKEEKKGIFSGHTVAHPLLTGVNLPVYIVNYVMMDYGTGAIFGVPAHDQRDFDFAKTQNLPIISVVSAFENEKDTTTKSLEDPYTGEGHLINSYEFTGLTTSEAREQISKRLISEDSATKETTYRLKDWGIGRQRYWGVPIPIIYCPVCGIVPVPKEQLPVTLPEDVTFDVPGNPLDRHPTWKHVLCPICGTKAQRETDTFDTFFESSWYFARFCDPHNTEKAFSKEKTNYWMPVKAYVGGIEHAVLHLLYARFFTKALGLCGYWDLSEPFAGLFTQGMVCHKTARLENGEWIYPEEIEIKNGKHCRITDGALITIGRSEKMSKSKCNVVGVTPVIESYGADAMRVFLLSDTPPGKDLEWTEEGVDGAWRYVNRVWHLFYEKKHMFQKQFCKPSKFSESANQLRKHTHKAIRDITESIENYALNKYIAHLRELSNALAPFTPDEESEHWALYEGLTCFIQLMAPVMPHLAEELWEFFGFTAGVHLASWPVYDETLLLEEKVTLSVQVNGKMRGTLSVPVNVSDEKIIDLLKKEPSLQKYLQGTWEKIIIIPLKVISIVIKI